MRCPLSGRLTRSALFTSGLFIVDGYYEVYVWEGWMLENDDDVRTGSGRQRWDRDRRLAMQTALHYAKGESYSAQEHRPRILSVGLALTCNRGSCGETFSSLKDIPA